MAQSDRVTIPTRIFGGIRDFSLARVRSLIESLQFRRLPRPTSQPPRTAPSRSITTSAAVFTDGARFVRVSAFEQPFSRGVPDAKRSVSAWLSARRLGRHAF